MQKCFVLDTNVLIHNPFAIYSFADNKVVIPITVIEELDRFKTSADKNGMHARQVLREIDALIKKGALKKGAKMKNKGTLLIDFGPRRALIPNFNVALPDNKIIATAYHLQKKGHTVFFISKDVNARIKAEALGIKARDYEKEKVEYANLYRGWKEIIIKKKDMAELLARRRLLLKGYSFFPNEYAFLKEEKNNQRVVVCKFQEETGALVPLLNGCRVMGISPLNMEQRIALDLLLNDNIKLVTLVGQAGTGKTLLALASALAKTIQTKPPYEKVLVARPIMPLGRDIGYLPGSKDKKLSYWMQPIFDNLELILKKTVSSKIPRLTISEMTPDALMRNDLLEVEALTFIRGRSIPNQFLIVDEAQNLTPHEIKTIISRAGYGTKIVLTGDPDQIDNPYLDANSNGLSYSVERLKKSSLFGHILLTKSERSELASLAVNEL